MSSEKEQLGLTRRGQLTAFAGAFVVYAFGAEARPRLPSSRKGAARWIARQEEIARALASGQIKPIRWCQEVERLAREVDLPELMAHVRQARITPAGEPFGNDPAKRYVRFVDEAGAPRKLSFGAALFDFEPHNVITPHGHRNMVSAHMVVDGRFRVRTFDRLRDTPSAMILKPRMDGVVEAGQVSTMCGDRGNVHWFRPEGGSAATFDVILSGLEPGAPDHEIRAVDPIDGRRLSDGTIKARFMSFEASSAKYTARL